MENVANTVNGSGTDEKIIGESGPSDETCSNDTGVTSTESKMNEGEDVFEEAVESQDHIPGEDWELDSGISIVAGPDGNVAVGIANSGPVMMNEDTGFVNEAEILQEAISITGDVRKSEEFTQEVDLDKKVEGSAGGESFGGNKVVECIDDGATGEEVSTVSDGESQGVFDDSVEEISEVALENDLRNEVRETKKPNDVEFLPELESSAEIHHFGTEAEAGAGAELSENKEVEGTLTGNDSGDSFGGNFSSELENKSSSVDGDGSLASVDRDYQVVNCQGNRESSSHSVADRLDNFPEEGKNHLNQSGSKNESTTEMQGSERSFAAVLKKAISLNENSVVTSGEPKSMTNENVSTVTKDPVENVESSQRNDGNHVLEGKTEEKDSVTVVDDRKVNNDTRAPAVSESPASSSATRETSNETRAPTVNENPASSSAKTENTANSSPVPAGLGRVAPLLEPAPRAPQQPRVNGAASQLPVQQVDESANGEVEEADETREKLQMIRVKFLRLARRLGQTPHNVVVAQVLYRLGLAEQLRGRNGGRVGAFSFDRASAMAEQLEASGQEPLHFSCTIMVLGKTGVGKSATINSIFDEVMFSTDAFDTGTKRVQDVAGTVEGIRLRVIDTPGLLPSVTDQRQNEKILHSIKRFIKKTPPDIVLYLDRLDMQSRDLSDMPLLRTITDVFGPSIWFNAIVVLTHAASAPPDGPNGTASSYDMFVTQRSHVVQQAIRQAAGDMRLMNPVSLVENHFACRTNRRGQRVLPNGQVWKPHLLLLSFASKILAEANALLKLQDGPPGKPFTTRARSPPLPFLLSSLLQPRPQVKLPEEQFDDEDGLDDDLDMLSESEDESEYDELPPFRRLTKAQLSKLTKAQKKAYFDELAYREKLFMKKQLKEERRRRRMMKKMTVEAKDQPAENVEEESSSAASVPVPMPDLALPASFDSDNPTHRYRYLDNSNQWLIRPVLDTHGWDHDVGYEGINLERLFVIKEKMPVSFSGQVTKDKKDANIQMEVAGSVKHGTGKSTSLGFDMQSVGKEMAYTLRSETRFSSFKKNKMMAGLGLSATFLNDVLSAGLKLEDKLVLNKWLKLVMTGGAITARGDVAYGGSFDATLRDSDDPLGRSLFTLGLSVMDWHGDLAIGSNIQCQLPIGRNTNLTTRANLNNRGAGQVSIRVSSSEQLQIALLGIIPLIRKVLEYRQQLQFGQ
ncbi:hypothetical protein MLD38_026773 [Melastoma candidum]|uniref:Uncharacterized protein n=1 Tax=Melastoma candidum TaxID=119954 RepID=A0ACB9P1H9_9MYRT|nr:hypothetical protein MLD38_026773 [Melastoma candidum]